MRNWISLIEANILKPFGHGEEDSLRDLLKQRFELHGDLLAVLNTPAPNLKIMGPRGNGDAAFDHTGKARFYIVRGNSPVGSLALNRQSAATGVVAMAFVLPEARRNGAGLSLYRAALHHGITIVSDSEISRKALSVWSQLLSDPTVEVRLQFNGEEHEVTTVEDVYQPGSRLIARIRQLK